MTQTGMAGADSRVAEKSELILDAWYRGDGLESISRAYQKEFGDYPTASTISGFVYRARQAGDRRAVSRKTINGRPNTNFNGGAPAKTKSARIDLVTAESAADGVLLFGEDPLNSPRLPHDACRYVLRGEGMETVVCGKVTESGHSYCAEHCVVCYERLRLARSRLARA